MDRDHYIDRYLELLEETDLEIDQVRKELEAKNLEPEDIKYIVRRIDSAIQHKALTRTTNRKYNELVYIGTAMIIVGVGITVATYTGIIDLGDSFLILYGPVISGVSLLLTGLARRK